MSSTVTRLWVAVIPVLLLAGAAAAADPNIAVIDVARVFEDYDMTRDLETVFDQARQALSDEADSRRGNIDQMRRGLAAFDPESDDYKRREQELIRAEAEFQVWSNIKERQLKADHKKWLLQIYRDTQSTVAAIATDRSIDLVLTFDKLTEDAPDSTALRQQILLQKVIYHSDRMDITDDVLKKLNDAYKARGGIDSLHGAIQDETPLKPGGQTPPVKP